MQQVTPVGPTAKAPAERFTGDVYLTMIHDGQAPSRINVALVRFTPGARSNWHRHDVGQTLHITEGVGLVGTRAGQIVRVRAGDTLACPPDEEHWHGAAADTFMAHITIVEKNDDGSDPTTWLEPVIDEQYQPANQQ